MHDHLVACRLLLRLGLLRDVLTVDRTNLDRLLYDVTLLFPQLVLDLGRPREVKLSTVVHLEVILRHVRADFAVLGEASEDLLKLEVVLQVVKDFDRTVHHRSRPLPVNRSRSEQRLVARDEGLRAALVAQTCLHVLAHIYHGVSHATVNILEDALKVVTTEYFVMRRNLVIIRPLSRGALRDASIGVEEGHARL